MISKPILAALQHLENEHGELTFWPMFVDVSLPDTMATRGLVHFVPARFNADGRVRWRITDKGRAALKADAHV